ncbi:MAG: hypothetical protein L0L47_07470, partial [Bifidobacterium mongoliense]|nr:hypothetical protein [Bifidobacterium mongoliense]
RGARTVARRARHEHTTNHQRRRSIDSCRLTPYMDFLVLAFHEPLADRKTTVIMEVAAHRSYSFTSQLMRCTVPGIGLHRFPNERPPWWLISSAVMRIAVMGYSGSGKSTLARYLGDERSLPVLHLDTVQFQSRWRERSFDEQCRIARAFMGEHESWVIDGNYSRLYLDERLDAADAIVLLRFNRWACLWRVMRRFVKFHGASRPSMSDGCIEHLDVAFVWWVLHQGRDAEHRRWYRDIDRRYQEKTVSIRNQRQLTHYTAHITNLQEHTI